jgi:peptide/nickel transport system substrate-binding protein
MTIAPTPAWGVFTQICTDHWNGLTCVHPHDDRSYGERDIRMNPSRRIVSLVVVAICTAAWVSGLGAQPRPPGEVVWAWHVTIAPTWFDPADTPAQITPFGMLYTLHDALVRPLPGERLGNSLAASWTESPDGLVYTFTLRPGLRFHNGDPCTTEDVKFSFERYRGTGAQELHTNVKVVEIVDPLTVRFHLHKPWPDFMTFYGTTATAAGIVVPKRYLEQVGEDGFKQHPIGLGPYKLVSHTPGIEVVLEAYEGYWRKRPHIKRLIMKGVPEVTTRLAMLKKGEADIAMALEGSVAEEVQRDSHLTLVDTQVPGLMWIEFTEQWDPTSVWADPRLRLAVNYALDRQAINEAACLGYCPPAGVIVPRLIDYALPREPLPYDPQQAKQLLAEAGYPNGFDAGDLVPIPPFFVAAEAVVNDLNAVGIRVKMRTMERAAFYSAWREKKLRGLVLVASDASGNAATRVETFIYSKGAYAYGGYLDLDALYEQQAQERDQGTRAALLQRIQQLTAERVMFAPLINLRLLIGVGSRVAEPALNTIPLYPFPVPEDLRLKDH